MPDAPQGVNVEAWSLLKNSGAALSIAGAAISSNAASAGKNSTAMRALGPMVTYLGDSFSAMADAALAAGEMGDLPPPPPLSYENLKLVQDALANMIAQAAIAEAFPLAELSAAAVGMVEFFVGGLLVADFALAIPLIATGVVIVALYGEANFGSQFTRVVSNWLSDLFGVKMQRRDPLIIDLSVNSIGVSFTALAGSQVHFDLDSDGFAERTGWISTSSAFVVMDRNGNGTIDNGGEMFGDASQNGFASIGALDSNHDGIISSLDTEFANLKVWKDLNQDGISQADELKSLSAAGVVSIDLNATAFSHSFRGDAQILAGGTYTNSSGEQREVVAASFASDRINSAFILPQGFQYDPEVFTLPNLRGYGQVPDLWVAMSLDPTLKQMVKDFIANLPTSVDAMVGATTWSLNSTWFPSSVYYVESPFEEIIVRWSGASSSSYPDDSLEMQATLEKFIGQQFLQGRLEPNLYVFDEAYFDPYKQFTADLAARFLTQVAQLTVNKPALDLFLALQSASANGQTLTQAQIDQLVYQAISQAENQPALPALLQHFANLAYDFSYDAITGDVAAFIDEELASLTLDPNDPWAGYSSWYDQREYLLKAVDPDGSQLDQRHRAFTSNRALPILQLAGHAEVLGTSSSDTLVAPSGVGNGPNPATLFRGGAGNDTITGGTGDDTFAFSQGFGNDVISDAGGKGDEIAFQDALSSQAVRFDLVTGSKTDVLITIPGSGDSILVHNFFDASGNARFEKISFADGVVLNGNDLRNEVISHLATSGDDVISGFQKDTILVGFGGNDTLTGLNGKDVLIGGIGNDILSGGTGGDTYQFEVGDGQDIIRDNAALSGAALLDNDVLVLGEGINPLDVIVSQADNGNDFILTFAGSTDQITLDQAVNSSGYRIEQVRFADGTIWSAADLLTKATAPTSAADVFYGGYDNDSLLGGGGDDTLTARDGGDTLTGGTGNDLLIGGNGADIYHFDLGDGQDIIRDSAALTNAANTDVDVVELGQGIAPGDVTVIQTDGGKDFVLKINGTTDQITLDQAMVSNSYRIEKVRFADGTIWTTSDLLAKATSATPGDDVFSGTAASELLAGGAGNDTLSGMDGNDILVGGTGNDILSGGSGADIYRFDLGDGQDIVRDNAALTNAANTDVDAIEFGQGILATDVTVTQADGGNDFVLKINGTTDQITLDQAYVSTGYRIEQIRFADGTIWSAADLFTKATTPTSGNDVFYGGASNEALSGGAGNDTLYGRSGNDLLTGGVGNDLMSGEAGDDIYHFDRGDGQDIVRDFAGNGFGGNDTIEFGAGIAPGDVTVIQADSGNDLILQIAGGTDQITLDNTANSTSYRIEQVRFADGTVWSAAELLTRATVPTGGNDVFYGGYDNDVLSGGAGNDTLRGMVGDDILSGGSGNDILDGGAGIDTVDYSDHSTGITVNLSVTAAQTIVAGESDTITAVENVIGGSANDTITGNSSANVLQGGAGDDRLTGGAGNDTLIGGSGTNDVAVFAGLQASYSIVTNGGVVSIVDNAPTVDGNDGTDVINGIEKVEFKGGVQVGVTSPIILDLDGKGVKTLTSSQSHATFDLDGDGRRDDTSWIGKTEGFLFLDRNGDGTLSGANELSFVDDLPGAASDLAGLRAFDSNGDGRLSADDARFASFRIWQDANGNGTVDRGEVLSLAQAGVKAINLTGTAVNAATAFGDVAVVNRGSYERTDGSTMEFLDAALTYFSASQKRPSHPRVSQGWKNGDFRDQGIDLADSPSDLEAAIAALGSPNETNSIASLAGLSNSEAFARFTGDLAGHSTTAARSETDMKGGQELPTEQVVASEFFGDALSGTQPIQGVSDTFDTVRTLALLRQDMAGFVVSSAFERNDWKSDSALHNFVLV